MESDGCSSDIHISSQEDIINLNCSCDDAHNDQIYITNFTGELDYPHCSNLQTIDIRGSPGLKKISFPDLNRLGELLIHDATELENISLPYLYPNSPGYIDPYFDLLGAPNLKNVTFGDITVFSELNLASRHIYEYSFSNITSITALVVCYDYHFENLRSVVTLQIAGNYNQYFEMLRMFSNITSLQTLTLTDVGGNIYFGNSLLVNNSLIIENCYSNVIGYLPIYDIKKIDSVGSDLRASNNTVTELNFRQLTTVSGDISIYNNTNCTLNLNQLSDVASLSLVDNVNTTLPWFPRLQRASNIHIRGYIDTSPGPNIFPALTAVSGNVTIEAWNDDFNCSKLVDQYQSGLIHNLACNGTNNITETNTGSSPGNTSPELSQGAWAGIGVGIGVFVIGTVTGMVWLLLRLKRWKNELIERIRQREALQEHHRNSLEMNHEPPNLNLLLESDGTGIIREKPDDHLREAGGRAIIAEHPDDHIRELPVPPAELEGAPNAGRRT
ncbi:hypothetical protein F5Y00DRAFT_274734 [Daldinia vernicosa]|uniref:uncharacterized protein n=1 Tax=Daldinia vernicosa TaxID=114800 RepID=UPI002007AC78|nr:uncharacterized protein F5Y00DRAFT_274734 [Daldinia vernicosa]KAI0843924.1 hypothetical protein F5Y00DRAFT_274734 [Daldinia vernicosa]